MVKFYIDDQHKRIYVDLFEKQPVEVTDFMSDDSYYDGNYYTEEYLLSEYDEYLKLEKNEIQTPLCVGLDEEEFEALKLIKEKDIIAYKLLNYN